MHVPYHEYLVESSRMKNGRGRGDGEVGLRMMKTNERRSTLKDAGNG